MASAADPGLDRPSWHAEPHIRQWAGMPRRVTQQNLAQWPPGAMPQVSVTNQAEPSARLCGCGDWPQHNAEAGENEQRHGSQNRGTRAAERYAAEWCGTRYSVLQAVRLACERAVESMALVIKDAKPGAIR